MSALPLHSPPQVLPRKRAVTWVRVSTAEQAGDKAGLPRQLAEVHRICSAKNYEIVDRVSLVDVSGTSVIHAPETQALIKRIERKEIDVIVVSEMSRLIRPDSLDFGILQICQQHSVVIDCGGSEHALETAEGYLSGTLMAVLGGHDRMIMLRRMLQSKEARRAQGKNPQAHITLPLGIGYDRKTEKYFLTPEIVRIQEAFRLVDEGNRNLSEIGRLCSIHQANVRNLLRNPIYRGERVYDKWRDQSRKGTKAGGRQGDRPKIRRPADKVLRVRICTPEEQPVSDDRWERVQAVLRDIREPEATGELRGVAAQIAKGLAGWEELTVLKDKKALLASLFTEIYFQGASIVSFKLSSTLVGTLDDAWRAVAEIPIPLPKPFRLREPEIAAGIPSDHRKCSRCHTVKPASGFYGDKRPACRRCCLDSNKRGHERRKGRT